MLKVNPEELIREGPIMLGTFGVQGGISGSDIEGLMRTILPYSYGGIDESLAGYKFVVVENHRGRNFGYQRGSVTSYSICALQEKTPVVVVMGPNDILTLTMRSYLSRQLQGEALDLSKVSFQDFLDRAKAAEARAVSGAVDFNYEGCTLSTMSKGFLRHRTYEREGTRRGEEALRQILTLEPEVKDWNVSAIYMSPGNCTLNLYDTGHAALWLHPRTEGSKLKAITDAATRMHNVFSADSVN